MILISLEKNFSYFQKIKTRYPNGNRINRNSINRNLILIAVIELVEIVNGMFLKSVLAKKEFVMTLKKLLYSVNRRLRIGPNMVMQLIFASMVEKNKKEVLWI